MIRGLRVDYAVIDEAVGSRQFAVDLFAPWARPAMQVACPYCGARPDAPCTRLNAGRRRGVPTKGKHPQRIELERQVNNARDALLP